jgi:hypothetical protein
MKKKIFISSTYSDLIPHREKVWELLQAFNVEISGMEKFGARKNKALSTCLEEVENSDIYIGIIGLRYGSVDEKSNKSFTQIEYEKAYSLNKEILIYIIDEDNCKIRPKDIDFENYLKLKDFKKILSSNHTIDKFANETDLVSKINQRLKSILQTEDIDYDFRPQKIECIVKHVQINDRDWVIIIGYRFGEPFEVFYSIRDELFLPPNVSSGWIWKRYDENRPERYDLQFDDNQGYKITYEGIHRVCKMHLFLITKLMALNVPIKAIIDILENLEIENEKMPIEIIRELESLIKLDKNK